MSGSTYRFRLEVPRHVRLERRTLEREDFYGWLWAELGSRGLLGIHEGTLLSEQAATAGLETDSWTVDSGEAPRDRDWISGQKLEEAELYFGERKEAESAARWLRELLPDLAMGSVQEQKEQDWDAEWKASFLSSSGLKVSPCWRILPAWHDETKNPDPLQPEERVLRINPGAGFGTGTHETTQLCLEGLAQVWGRVASGADAPVLDFGSGSGILSIGAALLGAKVTGIEIDPLAIDNAFDNARLNGVESRIEYYRELGEAPGAANGPFDVVLANILKPVLLQFADDLCRRVKPGGAVILSGLIAQDVEPVTAKYASLLPDHVPEVKALNEWRAIVWRFKSES